MTQGRFASNRIAGLTDGIFAIAMTLLVITIERPEVDGHMSSAAFRKAVVSQLPGFAAWLISFAILCRLWISQHRLFDGEVTLAPKVATVNFMFLGAVSFIPYPTSLVSVHPQQALSVFIFSAVFSVAGILLGIMWRMMEHDKMDPAERAYKNRVAKYLITWMLGAAVVACLLALVDPTLGILVWIVVPIMAVVRKKKKKVGCGCEPVRTNDEPATSLLGVTRTCHILAVTCGLILAAFASPAWSQSDTELSEQIWIDLNPSYYFDPHKKLYGSLGVRKQLEDDGWLRLVLQPGYRTKLPRRLFLSVGLDNFYTFNQSIADRWELRPVQALDLAWPRGRLPLRHRFRLEERFDFDTETWSAKISLRTRYKLSASYRFATIERDRFWQLTAAAEVFSTITGTQGQSREKSRLTFGIDRSLDLDIHFRFELTWQRESILFGDDDDTTSSLYFRFRLMKSWGESAGLRKETSS